MLLLRLVAPVILSAALAGASPTVVHRGQTVRIAATVGTSNGCLAHVQYADSTGVDLGIHWPDGAHRVAWSYRIPTKAALGTAAWSIRCGTGIYTYTGSWLVVPAGVTIGPKQPQPIVSKQGFSQRPDQFGTGSTVSYGLLIRNPSTGKQALNVAVTISFVGADGNVIGRKSVTVARIAGGETFALGGAAELSTQVEAKKLTASIRVGAYAKATSAPRPRVASARVVGSADDQGWVGEVDGDLVNDTTPQTLARATVSVVLMDGSGRIVGGGTGVASGPLASGARGTFAARLGFAAISMSDALRPVVSVVPIYR